MPPEIAATFLVLGPVLAERTRQRKEEARVHAERQGQDRKRWQRFVRIAQGWKVAELAREFIARLRKLDLPVSEPIDGRSLAEWLVWADARARAFDPVERGVDRVFADIGRIQSWSQVD